MNLQESNHSGSFIGETSDGNAKHKLGEGSPPIEIEIEVARQYLVVLGQ